MRYSVFSIIICVVLHTSCKKENAMPPKPKPNQVDTINYDGVDRTFILHIPPSYNESKKTPLVIAIHGYSSSAVSFERNSQLSSKADKEGFLIVYPNGYEYPWDNRNPRAWNVGGIWSYWTRETDDVGYISRLIDIICHYYAVDENRIYVTGHSNGASMSFRLGIELPCKIAAIAPHSAQVVLERSSVSNCPVPVLYLHAMNDDAVSITEFYIEDTFVPSVNSYLTNWAIDNGCSALSDTTYQDENVKTIEWNCTNNNMEIKWFLTSKGNHKWLTESNSGLSANDSIWKFFSKHVKSN